MEFDFLSIEPLRLFIAFFVGYFLTVSGSLSQIVTNNKLASSSTLGFDGVGVLVVLVAQFCLTFYKVDIALEHLSFLIFFVFFVACSYVVYNAKKNDFQFDIRKKMQSIILMGLGFNLFVGGLFSVIQFLFLSINYEFPTGLWFGNFKFYTESTVIVYLFSFFVTLFFINRLSKKLAFLSLGNDFAKGLDLDIEGLVRSALLLSLFLTGLIISYFGVFSFVGLIFPHILRMFKFFKYSIRNELVFGPIFSGAVLSGIDLICYHFTFFGAEVPVGMVCSVVGSFVLLLLLYNRK